MQTGGKVLKMVFEVRVHKPQSHLGQFGFVRKSSSRSIIV